MILWALALLMALSFAGSARANGAGAVTFTQTFKDLTMVNATNANPCSGAPGVLTITFNGVVHGTVLTAGKLNGTGWFTFTATGSLSFVPNDPSQPSLTGHVTIWSGISINLQNFVASSTFNAHAFGTDGSSVFLHGTFHVTVLLQSGTPVVVATVSMMTMTCG